MEAVFTERTDSFIDFIKKSPTAFHATDAAVNILKEHGALFINEGFSGILERGRIYYMTRNGSSLIAFRIPEGSPGAFMITASHTDSPAFRLKPNFEKDVFGKYTVLNTEKYGGMIISSWFDRPLSVAGRIACRENGAIVLKNVMIDRDLLVIPNVCIHFNRAVNDGYKYNPAIDCLPLYSEKGALSLLDQIADTAGVDKSSIIGHDLFLYNRTSPSVWGAHGEFFSAPRIDNLQCAFSTLTGFLQAEPTETVSIYAAFDNEETGSATKQGADSDFLPDTIDLICRSLSDDPGIKRRMLASSLMLSADNAHARHPLHPELSDGMNSPDMNGGIVIKTNADQRYTTDALSAALFIEICSEAGVPVQLFANRSDIAGGSTLGRILNTQVSLNTVDIGLAQLAMHSCYETAGVKDTEYMVRACERFYNSRIIRSAETGEKYYVKTR